MLKLLMLLPQPAKELLAVFKLTGEVDQEIPSYSSVAPVIRRYITTKS
jgi:hypothetical protein